MIYQLTTTSTSIIRLSDGAHIPDDPRNIDYKDYLEWVNEGNTPLPAPAPPPPPPNYIAFWNALLTSNVYGSIRTQSMTSLPMNTLATEFIALIGDAKADLKAASVNRVAFLLRRHKSNTEIFSSYFGPSVGDFV